MPHLHSSQRRPEPLKDADYDHEINLIDHTHPASNNSPSRSRSAIPTKSLSTNHLSVSRTVSDSSSRRHSDAPLHKHETKKLSRNQKQKARKYRKFQDRRLETEVAERGAAVQNPEGNEDTPSEVEERGRTKFKKHKRKESDSAIDVLYENQRGFRLCGLGLFSSRALGNLDPSPWTNIAQKTSAISVEYAQLPDPSWIWAWEKWSINKENDVDEDGWEYSFAFSKKFSWHGPKWWNSFVRRRAWIRKRVRKDAGYQARIGHGLNEDYFTIHPAAIRSRSVGSSTVAVTEAKRFSIDRLALRIVEPTAPVEDICSIGALMSALKLARIDREKLEAVENFIRNGEDELYYLKESMHDVMKLFVFQASRKILLTNLHKVYDRALEEQEQREQFDQSDQSDDEGTSPEYRRLDNLEAALEHADEEVRRLEYWSDVKSLAENGETLRAVDNTRDWDSKRWTGIDGSDPKDVVSSPRQLGYHNWKENGKSKALRGSNSEKADFKGKGKAKE